MTLIVLLILAGVSLSGLFSEKGLFKRTENASAKYNEAKAREVLETVLLADGQYEKNTNPKYNQDDFLDELIKSEIPGSDVKGDVAIIGEYAYELDRSVPKIGRYLGKASDLVWPTVDATVNLSDDKKDATITITASEEKQGINKIEVWLLGEMIKEYKYDPSKPEATENYTATQNGTYTIKAYGDLMASKKVEVDGIVASVKFEPNGNEEWKKSHSTTVTIQETADKIVSSKYVWTNSVTTPEDNEFQVEQTFNSGDTITGGNETMTGTYYLWTMLETQSGEKIKWKSDGFNFDNEAPNITNYTVAKYSETGITYKLTVQDEKAGVSKIEFYVDDKIKDKYTKKYTANTSNITISENITEITTGSHKCKVIIYDALENKTEREIDGTTKLYAWKKYDAVKEYTERGWQALGTHTYSNTDGPMVDMVMTGQKPYLVVNSSGPKWISGGSSGNGPWLLGERLYNRACNGAEQAFVPSNPVYYFRWVRHDRTAKTSTWEVETNEYYETATGPTGDVLGIVTSTKSDEYPNNSYKADASGNLYWYVKTTSQ